jgi:hypothetical protein
MTTRKRRMFAGSVEIQEMRRIRYGILAHVVEVLSLFIRIVSFSGLIIVMLASARFLSLAILFRVFDLLIRGFVRY